MNADDLVLSIGRHLSRARDSFFEAEVQFGELRRLLKAEQGARAVHATPIAVTTTPAEALHAESLKEVPRFLPPAARAATAKAERKAPPGKYLLDGEPRTALQLADLAGCKRGAMEQRLKTMTPAEAVAAGEKVVRTSRALVLKQSPTPKPGRVLTRVADIPEAARLVVRATFKADAEVIVPDDVKRTVAPTPVGRFDVDTPIDRPFSSMRPGQYEDTGSALSRAYREREA